MRALGRPQRLALLLTLVGVVVLGVGMATSSAQLPFDPYWHNPNAGPPPTLDRTGPVIPRWAVTTSTRGTKGGAFTFAFGPFDENVTGKVTFESTKAFAAARKRRLALGTKRFTGLMDEKVRIRVKLSKRSRKALKRARAVRIGAALKVSDENGNVTRRTYTFVLKAPR